MLHKLPFLSILFGLLLFSSCKSEHSTEVQKLYDEVMVIHDEVMPEMGTIHKLKKQLKGLLKNPSATLDQADVKKNIEALDQADEAMMDWMHQFKVPKEASDKIKLEYLAIQKEKMAKVNTDMKTIIKNAQDAVNSYK